MTLLLSAFSAREIGAALAPLGQAPVIPASGSQDNFQRRTFFRCEFTRLRIREGVGPGH